MIVVQVKARSFALITEVIVTVPPTSLGLMGKSMSHVLELEVTFIRLLVKAFLCCFEKHSIICSTWSGHMQMVVGAMQEDHFVVAC